MLGRDGITRGWILDVFSLTSDEMERFLLVDLCSVIELLYVARFV